MSTTVYFLIGRVKILLLLTAMVILTAMDSKRDQQRPRHPDYQVKAAFIYHFTGFVKWPDQAFATQTAPFIIGVYGEDPFGTYIDDLVKGENVGGHPVVVRRVATDDELTGCHILFLTARRDRLREILQQLKTQPVLTVSDQPNFCNDGGMVRLYNDNNRIRLMININAVNAAHLQASSKLLEVAELFETGN